MALWAVLFMYAAARLSLVSGVPRSEAVQQVLDIVNNPERYNKDIIPYPNRPGPVDVQTTLYIRDVDIDDVNMIMNVDVTFRMEWLDSRLSRSFPTVPYVRISDTSKFWVPDAFFKESVQTETMSSIHPETFIQVSNKGNVLHSSRLRLSLNCPMNLKRFPHDQQICGISFASYGFAMKDVVFSFKDQEVEVPLNHLTKLKKFEFVRAEKIDCASKTSTGAYTCLQVNIHLNRVFGTYLLEWYFPCLSLVTIAFLSEFLAASALLPRLVLTVGPLLTLVTATLNYGNKMASVSYATAFDVFTGISFFAIFATTQHVIASYYYDCKPAEEPKEDLEGAIPKWKKLASRLRAKGDFIARVAIIGFYSAFLFLYFLAYGLT